MCVSYVASQRREKVAEVIRTAREARPRSLWAFLTLTVRHHLGVKWKDVQQPITTTWRRWTQTTAIRCDVRGFIRTDECTWGENGLHAHRHVIVELKEGTPPEVFEAKTRGFWKRSLKNLGRTADWQPGWCVFVTGEQLDAMSGYLTKAASLAHELTNTTAKGSNPWDLPPEEFAKYLEASQGFRLWASGGTLALGRDDESEINDDRETQEGVVLAHVTPVAWTNLTRRERRDLLALVYDHTLNREQFLAFWKRANKTLGGALGVGPPPTD